MIICCQNNYWNTFLYRYFSNTDVEFVQKDLKEGIRGGVHLYNHRG